MHALGRHLLIELSECDARVIDDLEAVKSALVEAAHRARATIVDSVFHEFNPCGISAVVVIAESHLSIHTWPEHRYAAVDIFSCGSTLRPERAVSCLIERFAATQAAIVEVPRGVLLGSVTPNATTNPTPVGPMLEVDVWKVLTGLGWSCQKPERRAVERDEPAIARWKRNAWPRIKKRRPPGRPPRVRR